MKYLTFSLILFVFMACSTKEDIEPESVNDQQAANANAQKWQLVLMSGNFSDTPPAVGTDMDWQEHYLLYPDNTFIKSRTHNGSVTEKSGTYEVVTEGDEKYVELTYPSDNELIGNCTNEPKEMLLFESESKLIGTWWACDGPGLVYEKVEEEEGEGVQ